MAKIPDAIQLQAPEGAAPSTAAPAPTDFGLGAAGQAFAAAGMAQHRDEALQIRAQAAADQKSVMPALLALQGANEKGFSADAAAYTGQTPGFAADQLSKAHARVGAFVDPNWTPGQHNEFVNMANGEANRVAQNANAHEAAVLAKPIAEATANAQNAQIAGGLTGFNADYQARALALKQGWKVGDPPLADQIGAQWDASAAPQLAALPPMLQPALQAELTQRRTAAILDAQTYQVQHTNDHVLTAVANQGATISNTIATNPAYYDTAVKTDIPRIIASMPAGMQEAAARDFGQQAAVARIDGLLAANDPMTASAELKAGKYNAILTAPQLEAQLARVDSAVTGAGPKTADQIVAAHNYRQGLAAEVQARATRGETTGFSLAHADQVLGQQGAAEAQILLTQADRQHAVMGSIGDMSIGKLEAARVLPDPDPHDPDYATKLELAAATRQAAAQELQSRQSGAGAWAFDLGKNGVPTKGVGANAAGLDRGSNLQDLFGKWHGGGDGAVLATTSLGAQAQAGIAPAQRQVIPQAYAAQLAAEVNNAPPEQKLQALSALARRVEAMPATVKLADGSFAAPQQVLLSQLRAAGVNPRDASALVDYGSDPAKLGRYVQAALDPAVNAKPNPAEKKEIDQLTAQVKTNLAPFFSVAAPLPGSTDLYQARVDRSVLVARSLMAHGASLGDAARAATADMTAGYRYVDGWRMPEALAGQVQFNLHAESLTSFAGFQDGATMVKQGAATTMAALSANGNKGFFAPDKVTAVAIAHSAQWVASPDNSGLVLMIPHPGAPYEQVHDVWGRPIARTWQQLQDAAKGQPVTFDKPPPQAIGPGGAPVAAATRQAQFAALSAAVLAQESGGHTGLKSSAGALGLMQVMPSTVETYAPRLGLPVDLHRAQWDDEYNKKIGNAALADLVNHFGNGGPGGVTLALAAYNAGPGNVEGYTKDGVYHPGWLQTIGDPRTGKISVDDFVRRAPFAETRAYVQAVLPAAVRRLQAQHEGR